MWKNKLKSNVKMEKEMSKSKLGATALVICLGAGLASADTNYGPFPITLKGYNGTKSNSVSYTGQIARHVLHDSVKKLAGTGDGGANSGRLAAEILSYFHGSDKNKSIIAPVDKGDFNIKQETLNEISSGKNLSGKTYKGVINAWPGQMTGPDVIVSMIKKAAATKGGFDPVTGYNYPQLISKFTMGAVSYNQTVNNYLDGKLAADSKPNNKPYKEGAYYTGKEHSWDEAFGYWGAAAHSLNLTAKQNYDIAKMKDLSAADANGDGLVDLKSEYNFGHAYYGAAFDKGGKTTYFNTITKSFIDGRKIIANASGEKLSDGERAELYALAKIIGDNWEGIIAEAVFKYAGSVYKDINKLQDALSAGAETDKIYAAYGKHWGELKGFSMALQVGKNNLGATAAELNRLIGFGPVTMNNSYVTGVDSNGNYAMDRRRTWGDYQLHMLKIQKMMVDEFGVKARNNDQLSELEALASSLSATESAETD